MAQAGAGQFEPLEGWKSAREPIIWLDGELKIMWVNPAWEALTGHRRQAVAGLVCHAHSPSRAGDTADLAASFHPPQEALSGLPCGVRTQIFHADGETLWRRVEFWPFSSPEGALIGLLGIVRV